MLTKSSLVISCNMHFHEGTVDNFSLKIYIEKIFPNYARHLSSHTPSGCEKSRF